MPHTTVFKARKIITMDPNRPVATHVAVRDGLILAAGDETCADPWGGGELSDELSDHVLMPGLVEGHAHMMAGAVWNYAYAGYHDRIDPQGRLWKGMTGIEEVVAGLKKQAESLKPGEPLVGWGFDPIFLDAERLNRFHLDSIAEDRPAAIVYSNFHLMCVNSKALELAQYTSGTNVAGVAKGPDGEPTGELQEMAAMFPVMRRLGIDFKKLAQAPEAIASYGEVARRAGVTTITDLFSTMEESDLASMKSVVDSESFPARIVPAISALSQPPEDIAGKALRLKELSSDKIRLGAVKLMTDGSIQGYTARVKWPHYVTGHPNGIWNTAPEMIEALCRGLHEARVQMHIHVNGDEASSVTLDALESAMSQSPWRGHRHVLQHCQMMGADQLRRCAELGVCVNIFANHIYYFGDQHAKLTIGPDRAARMDACATADSLGVHYAIHSDAPVTPLNPLFTAWCAVNRRTMSGEVLGPEQRISVEKALHAITLGAAYTLKLDGEIGSIETGKKADFAILDRDPLGVLPGELKDIRVMGTALGGKVFLA